MSGSSLAKNVECNALSAKALVADKGLVLRKGLAVAKYDFATDGGTIAGSPIRLRGDYLPKGAVVTNVYYNVTTLLAGGAGATVSIGNSIAGQEAAYKAAGTLAANGLSTTGWKDGIPVGTGATFVAATSALSNLEITVGVADLTQGAFTLYVEYLMPVA